MRPGLPSRTAQHNALFRALEQRLPQPLFEDPFAQRFLRGRYRFVASFPASWVAGAIDRLWPGPRAAVTVRTRYIDDAVRLALSEGLDQIVILGAGFDSRAYRLPIDARVRVFEVDHPATQAMKREVLGTAPAYVTYVPIDFVRGCLDEALGTAGLRSRARTLFLWEGVSNYLDASSVDTTLRFIGRTGSGLLFTYVDRVILDGTPTFEDAPASLRYVRKLGEPFTFGLDPREIVSYMAERGLDVLEDLALSAAAERYCMGSRPKVSAYYHVVRARCRG